MNTSLLTKRCHEQQLQVQAQGAILEGSLVVPQHAEELIIFVQIDRSCRLNPQNYYLAHILQQHEFATLLLDLLPLEDRSVSRRGECLHYDISTLAMRLTQVPDFLLAHPDTQHLKMSYLGLQRGGEVAILSAAERPQSIHSTILLGCDTDRLSTVLPYVKSATLLLLEDNSSPNLEQCHHSLAQLASDHSLLTFHCFGSILSSSNDLEFVGRQMSQWLKHHHETPGY